MKNTTLSTYCQTCHEVELHYVRPLYKQTPCISCHLDAEKAMRKFINAKRIDFKEFFWVLFLSNANQLLYISEVAVGSTAGVGVPLREILQLALRTNSSAVIACHNHPSGTLIISENDQRFTKRLTKALKQIDIRLLDHLIITSESCISFSQEGEL